MISKPTWATVFGAAMLLIAGCGGGERPPGPASKPSAGATPAPIPAGAVSLNVEGMV
jgi:hypothetical protein